VPLPNASNEPLRVGRAPARLTRSRVRFGCWGASFFLNCDDGWICLGELASLDLHPSAVLRAEHLAIGIEEDDPPKQEKRPSNPEGDLASGLSRRCCEEPTGSTDDADPREYKRDPGIAQAVHDLGVGLFPHEEELGHTHLLPNAKLRG